MRGFLDCAAPATLTSNHLLRRLDCMKWLLILFPFTLFASFQDEVTTAAPSEDVRLLWCELLEKSCIECCGDDADVRPLFVTLQGIFEQQLAAGLGKSVQCAAGVIHTPMPTTPLCTKGEVSPELVDPLIIKDPERLKTVKMRTTTLRDYLHQGGELIVAYPKGGLEKRNEEQRRIYQEELARYPNLKEMVLKCDSLPEDLVGATYFIKLDDGVGYFFSIKMTQANAPGGESFGLWFGTYEKPCIVERFKRVCGFLGENQ